MNAEPSNATSTRPTPAALVAHLVAGLHRGGLPTPVGVVAASRQRHGAASAARVLALAGQGDVEGALVEALGGLDGDERCTALRHAAHRVVHDARHGPAASAFLARRIELGVTVASSAGLYLSCQLHRGAAIDHDLGSPLTWVAGLQWLGDDIAADVLIRAAAPLRERFPDAAFLQEVTALLERVPPAHPLEKFRDDSEASVQFVPSVASHADALLICVSGDEGRIGLPHTFFHRWISGLPVHTLYLRDPSGAQYRNGIAVLGDSRAEMVETARLLAAALKVRQTVVLGNSNGCFAAIELGLDLDAARILVFAPRAGRLVPHSGIRRSQEERDRDLDEAVARLTPRLDSGGRTAAIACVYGAGNAIDVAAATRLCAHPAVAALPLPNYRQHNTIVHCVHRDRLRPLLRWLTGVDRVLPAI